MVRGPPVENLGYRVLKLLLSFPFDFHGLNDGSPLLLVSLPEFFNFLLHHGIQGQKFSLEFLI